MHPADQGKHLSQGRQKTPAPSTNPHDHRKRYRATPNFSGSPCSAPPRAPAHTDARKAFENLSKSSHTLNPFCPPAWSNQEFPGRIAPSWKWSCGWRGRTRIDFRTCGESRITVYAQQEVVKELIAARIRYDAPIFLKLRHAHLETSRSRPRIHTCRTASGHEMRAISLKVRGFHGIAGRRAAGQKVFMSDSIPGGAGILANACRLAVTIKLPYHERGFH